MGCKQSKSTAVVLELDPKQNDANGVTSNTKGNKTNRNGKLMIDDTIVSQPTQTISPNSNQSIKNTTSNTSIPSSSSKQQQQQNTTMTEDGVAVNRTKNTKTTNSNTRTSDRVYKLLLKQRMQYHNNRQRNNHSNTTTSGTGTAGTNNSVPILDETAVLQAMSPKSASYRNPETQFSPLHLAVQLIDSHSMAAASASAASTSTTTDTTTNNNKKKLQHQYENSSLLQVISELIRAYPEAVHTPDVYGYIPLHYAIAPNIPIPSSKSNNSNKSNTKSKGRGKNVTTSPTKVIESSNQQQQQVEMMTMIPASVWPLRTSIIKLLLLSDTTSASYDYLIRNDIIYNTSYPIMNGCTPLYRIIQMLPDDDTIQFAPPTLEYIHVVLKYIVQHTNNNSNNTTTTKTTTTTTTGTSIISMGNVYDGDKCLTLLYRRFTRQFDLAEKFFDGDNSRIEVVHHRRKYKTAASNTWKIIELLLKQQEQITILSSSTSNNNNIPITTTYRTVHRAVQGETPPDLLRYIVETNANDLTIKDEAGNLPLHYAARYQPKDLHSLKLVSNITTSTSTKATTTTGNNNDKKSSFPAFYSKYVMDELLYKYPEAASIPDADGNYPLVLAIRSGKQWIGGGIKSLYDAYPDALLQINLAEYPALQRALSNDHNYNSNNIMTTSSATPTTTIDGDNENMDENNEQYHEEKKVSSSTHSQQQQQQPKQKPHSLLHDIIRDEQHDAIMLVQDENVDISEVVTSMWAHEEDAGVQMLGCIAIRRLLDVGNKNTAGKNTNGTTTIDQEHCLRIALSAIPAVVNAMKAHPNEVIVQEKACHTLRAMASIDGQREVSFVASGAVAAIVGAMQAHVSDPNVQEEACGALGQILHYGGADRATVIASVSGVTAMMNAIAAHPNIVHVQREGCIALCEMTNYYTTANIPELPRSQTEPLLEHAKTMFPNECTESVDILLSRLT